LKISVITPSFNSGNTIKSSIQSVLAQDYKNYEHIVVDGNSSDNTKEILKKYSHLIWVSEPDTGQSNAMNKGFRLASGDIIIYLNADDYFLSGAFSSVIPHFQSGEKVVMGKVLVRTQRANNVQEWVNDPKTDIESMLRHWEVDAFCVNPVGYFYHRTVQEKIPFNEKNNDKQDLEFLLEIGLKYKIKKVNIVFGVFNHSLTTKTARSQLIPSHWNNQNFSFIERLLNYMPEEYKKIYYFERERGYQLRRHWTIRDSIDLGMTKDLIDSGEIIFLPEDELKASQEKETFVEHNRLAAKRDWIIPVLTMGKVAGKSIHAKLKSIPFNVFPVEVYHIHQINEETLSRNLPGKRHFSVGLSLQKILKKYKNDFKWKFIVGMREPIGCCLSLAFDNINHDKDVIDISDMICQSIYPYISTWFDVQIKDSLGINIFDYEFNKKNGYSIIKKNNIEVMLYRMENLSQIFSKAMEDFIGIPKLKLSMKNITTKKSFEKINEKITQNFYLENEFLEKVYSNRIVKYFYSEEEISEFYNYWRKLKKQKKPRISNLINNVNIIDLKADQGNNNKEINVYNFCDFTYSKMSHLQIFNKKYGKTLFGKQIDINSCDLKVYQDLLVFSFIKNNLPKQSKILEVGGGNSRILNYFKKIHECWNIDKFEGEGNGPVGFKKTDYKTVIDYIGSFNEEIPDNYFDLVFSISVLEHVDHNNIREWNNILDDINRVLKRGGVSFHCIDIVMNKNGNWMHKIIPYIYKEQKTINKYVSLELADTDPDLYVMSKEYYEKTWIHTTKRTYEEFGRPASYNILWINA